MFARAGILGFCFTAAACGEKQNSNDFPLSHWLDDENPCVSTAAKSILDSGRPWPNEVTELRNGKTVLLQYDVWLFDQLYVLPGSPKFLIRNGFDEKRNPWKYSSVSGHVESLLGIPQRKFKHPYVGGTLYGNVYCLLDRSAKFWPENRNKPNPTAESIQRIQREPFRGFTKFQVRDRADIGMTEVWARTDSKNIQPGGDNVHSVAYLPNGRKVLQTINGVTYDKPIWCNKPHDPDAPPRGYVCGTWIWLSPGISISFQVYQQYLPLLPAVHDRMLAILEQSRRK